MHGEPIDRCFLLAADDDQQIEHPKDVDTFIKQVFGEEEVSEVKEIFEIEEENAEEPENPTSEVTDKSSEDTAVEKETVVDTIDEEISEWEEK